MGSEQGGGVTAREASKARSLALWEEQLWRLAPKLITENRHAPHPYWDQVHKQDTAMVLPGGLLRRGPWGIRQLTTLWEHRGL